MIFIIFQQVCLSKLRVGKQINIFQLICQMNFPATESPNLTPDHMCIYLYVVYTAGQAASQMIKLILRGH